MGRFYEACVFNEHDGTYRAVFLAPYRHDATVPPKRGGSLPKISKRSMCSESLRLNLNFMPGDIQFVPNHAILLQPISGLQKRSSSAKLIQQRFCFC